MSLFLNIEKALKTLAKNPWPQYTSAQVQNIVREHTDLSLLEFLRNYVPKTKFRAAVIDKVVAALIDLEPNLSLDGRVTEILASYKLVKAGQLWFKVNPDPTPIAIKIATKQDYVGNLHALSGPVPNLDIARTKATAKLAFEAASTVQEKARIYQLAQSKFTDSLLLASVNFHDQPEYLRLVQRFLSDAQIVVRIVSGAENCSLHTDLVQKLLYTPNIGPYRTVQLVQRIRHIGMLAFVDQTVSAKQLKELSPFVIALSHEKRIREKLMKIPAFARGLVVLPLLTPSKHRNRHTVLPSELIKMVHAFL